MSPILSYSRLTMTYDLSYSQSFPVIWLKVVVGDSRMIVTLPVHFHTSRFLDRTIPYALRWDTYQTPVESNIIIHLSHRRGSCSNPYYTPHVHYYTDKY